MPTVNYSAFTASNVGRLLAEIADTRLWSLKCDLPWSPHGRQVSLFMLFIMSRIGIIYCGRFRFDSIRVYRWSDNRPFSMADTAWLTNICINMIIIIIIIIISSSSSKVWKLHTCSSLWFIRVITSWTSTHFCRIRRPHSAQTTTDLQLLYICMQVRKILKSLRQTTSCSYNFWHKTDALQNQD